VKVSGFGTPAQTDWSAVYAEATAFLSPAQVAALRAVSERNDLFKEANALEAQLAAEQVAGPSGG
jgi:hypothetical protein